MNFENLSLPTKELQIGSKTYNLKIASTQNSREVGLSEIEYLPPNSGLLFRYGKQRHPNAIAPQLAPIVTMCTLFNLTVIFLLKNGQIVHIFNNLKADPNKNIETATRYYCPVPADLMIELPEDTCLQLEIGQKIDISNILQKHNLQ